jgi:outer membrane protein insertion porin family
MSTPTLFGFPVQSSLVLEHSREDERATTLVENRTTAAWEQRVRYGALSLSYGLRFERSRTIDTKPLDPDFAVDVTGRVGRFTSSITWDTRDDPADSATGTFLSSNLEHASRRLGSDLPFVRSLSQAYHFREWRGIVLASAARFGVVQAIGDIGLISDYRFFGGGARTLRGVEEDGLGARDFLGSPAGGESLLLFNQEVRLPIYRWVRGVAFVDAGNVFTQVRDVALGGMVGSAGVGLRVVTPFVLLRVDYGKAIWNRPAQDSGRWVFGIGQTF